MKIIDLIHEKGFSTSIELVPPRNGERPDALFDAISRIRGLLDFVSVTKGAGGSLRGGTLPLSFRLQDRFSISAAAHFVCREHTVYEIENELADLNYFGIVNVLALRGDAPAGQDATWEGDYPYAYRLVRQIKDMNKGIYLPRKGVDNSARQGYPTDFCVFVAGHPEDPIEDEISHLRFKMEAGADGIITQMVFSAEDFQKYVTAIRRGGIKLPVIAGIRPLISLKQAEGIEKFFKLSVPSELKEGLSDESTAREFGIAWTQEMVRKIRGHGAAGAHFFVLQDIGLVGEIFPRHS